MYYPVQAENPNCSKESGFVLLGLGLHLSIQVSRVSECRCMYMCMYLAIVSRDKIAAASAIRTELRVVYH